MHLKAGRQQVRKLPAKTSAWWDAPVIFIRGKRPISPRGRALFFQAESERYQIIISWEGFT